MSERITIQVAPFEHYQFGGRQILEIVRMSWFGRDSQCYSWNTNVEGLKRCSDDIRDVLEELYVLYHDAHETRQPVNKHSSITILRKLARCGIQLYAEVFAGAPKELRKFLSKDGGSPNPVQINIYLSANLQDLSVPWGLIFDPYTLCVTSPKTDEDFKTGFWNISRMLATIYQDIDMLYSGKAQRDEASLASVFNEKAFRDAGGKLTDWPQENIFFAWDDFVYADKCDQDRVLHFFSHAIKDCLYFEDDKPISSGEFRRYASLKNPETWEILIANACNTHFIATDRWIEAAWSHGMQGFIGIESEVPSAFALVFGRDLIKLILSNHNSGEKICKLFRNIQIKHWPLSLLYGLYANPNIIFSEYSKAYKIKESHFNWCETFKNQRGSPVVQKD